MPWRSAPEQHLFWEDRVLLFDCIEFNDSFRFIDVMQDAAFAIMDLQAARRPDLASLLMNIYVERTGDWRAFAFAPVPDATRLCTGKINSLLSEEPGVDESARHEAYEAARKYYRQAWEYARGAELRQGRLILVCGLSGAGKSTVGRYLAKELPAVHIRSDAVRKHLGGISLDSRGEPSLYAPPMTARTYDRLLELGLLLAGEGFSVILDARYDRRANRLRPSNAPTPRGFHCKSSIATLRRKSAASACSIAAETSATLRPNFWNSRNNRSRNSPKGNGLASLHTPRRAPSILARWCPTKHSKILSTICFHMLGNKPPANMPVARRYNPH